MKILVTGGAGFVGSHLIRYLINRTDHHILNLDCLTYAGNLSSLADISNHRRYAFRQLNIIDRSGVNELVASWQPDWIIHLAAETHVDRSIDAPGQFIQTNVTGTFNLLEAARHHLASLTGDARQRFRFLHVSTDEVYGSLAGDAPPFSETSAYDPRSPYSASKAAADHLARAWQNTWQLPVLITNSCNNFGPFQFPEKLIPFVILRALTGQSIPVFGQGQHIRDWLYVEDHVEALVTVARNGRAGETYHIGSDNQQPNIQVVKLICEILDAIHPVSDNPTISAHPHLSLASYSDLITLVDDRPGHDMRYAMDASKIQSELGWASRFKFSDALRQTVQWYLDHRSWWEEILTSPYQLTRQGLDTTAPAENGTGS